MSWKNQTLGRCWYCKQEIVLHRLTYNGVLTDGTWCLALWQRVNTNGEDPYVTYGTAQCEPRDNHPRVHDPMPASGDVEALNAWLDAPTIAPPSAQ